jgi:hypothetical protein
MRYTDITGCNMVGATVDTVEEWFVDTKVKAKTDSTKFQMVGIVESLEDNEEPVIGSQFGEQ